MVRCVFSPSLLKVKEEKQQHNTKNLCGMMSGNTEFRPTFFRSVAPIKVWPKSVNFGQLFETLNPKKLAEIGYFFFYSLPKKQKIPPSKVVQFYKTFIFALEVLRIKRRIYP